ncbi:MAG: DUF4197 domain-containing protein [Alphaproteobacteria bacterium]|nr:DUF4197 domain-containing protein [Alphaproteobacteria bacterium]
MKQRDISRIFRVSIVACLPLIVFNASPAKASNWLNTVTESLNAVNSDDVSKILGSGSSGQIGLTSEDIISGLKDALKVGVETVAGQIGATDGFNGDPDIHIPLPDELVSVQSTLRKFGMSGMADEVELKLNRGAEAAMPKARDLVVKAIQNMTFEDAKSIYDGPNDAATSYFKRVATADLEKTIAPVIDQSLQDVGAMRVYDQLVGEYESIPFVPDLKADLTQHATDLALAGLFHYLAIEEAAIRENPAKRTTEILQKVFGQ